MTSHKMHITLMLALTFSTGVVDAVGYLGYDRIFTGNMTGNVVVLGMALTGAEGLPVLRPALALLLFIVGAALGGRLLPSTKGVWTRATSGLFFVVGLGLVATSVFAAFSDAHTSSVAGTITTSAVAALMGMQAAAARRLGVADVTTVVVTSTIVGLASDSKLAGGDSDKWVRRFLAVLLILLGALVGAASLHVNHWLGIVLAAVLVMATAAWGEAHRRQTARLDVA